MQFIINQAIILFVSVALLSSSIDASGGIRGGGGRFLSTSVTTNVLEGEYCGSEGQRCAIDGEVVTNGQIRYGHSGSNAYSNWRDITDDKPFTCQGNWKNDHTGFGMDPKNGSKKECYWRENPSEAENKVNESIKVCAGEGRSCACVGGQARYGKDGNGNKAGDRWTNWIDVRPGAHGVFDNGSINCVKSSFGNFDPAKNVLKECQCRDIPTDTQGVISNVQETTQDVVSNVQDTTQDVVSNVKDTTQDAVSNVKETTQDAVSNVKDTTQDVVSNVKETTQDVVSNVQESTQDAVSNVKETTQDAVSNVVNQTQDAVSNVKETTQDAVSNVVNQTQDAVSNVKDTTQDALSSLLKTNTLK